MSKTITVENLIKLLPPSLLKNKQYRALAIAIAKELYKIYLESYKVIIYAEIDKLDEKVLDVLAVDFNVAWYDPNYSIEIKRNIIKDNVKVHNLSGTKRGLEIALGNIFKDSKVQEWFEYNGSPYKFKLIIDITENGLIKEQENLALEKIKFYKNVRSELESINYTVKKDTKMFTSSFCETKNIIKIYPCKVSSIEKIQKINIAALIEYSNTIIVKPKQEEINV